jgi:hypothetical protein
MDASYRNYLARENHSVDAEVLERALESFEGVAVKFSSDFIEDARQRDNYNRNVKRVKAEVLKQVANGSISAKEGAEFCYEMRNKIMTETRARTSVAGRAVAEREKVISPALEKLLDEKSGRKFGKRFNALGPRQKSTVHYEIIESSARPNTKFNIRNKMLRTIGKVLIVVTVAYVVYDVVNAQNKVKEVIKQGAVMAGGLSGTILAGSAASLVCGPGAPVCAVALLIGGGIAAGWVASEVVELFDDELEEFTRWQVK